MSTVLSSFGRSVSSARMLLFLGAGALSAHAQTNLPTTWEKDFIKTNGEYVIIGGHKMIETNSPANTEAFKQFEWRMELLKRLLKSNDTNRLDRYVAGAWALVSEYRDDPKHLGVYYNLAGAAEAYKDNYGNPAKARALTEQLAHSDASEDIKRWATGFLRRLDLVNHPVTMKFTAVDGQKVDLAQMRGKVVLVDFWETGCGGCIKEMPFVKAAYDKFHAQGLEIIGISGDTDKDKLNRFVKEKNLPWPEWMDNKIAPDFGVDTLPQIFLLDKRGVLRFDNVKANDKPHRPGDTTTFESKITSLLTEP